MGRVQTSDPFRVIGGEIAKGVTGQGGIVQEFDNENTCPSCLNLFVGPPVVLAGGDRMCLHCFRAYKHAIIRDEAMVSPYGKGNGKLR